MGRYWFGEGNDKRALSTKLILNSKEQLITVYVIRPFLGSVFFILTVTVTVAACLRAQVGCAANSARRLDVNAI